MKKEIESQYEDIENVKEETKIDQVPKTYELLNNYWNNIESNLPKYKNSLIRFIANYRNKNIKKLETPYPCDYPAWIPACNKVLYASTGIDEDDFIKTVLTIRGHEGYIDPYLKDKAPYILALLIARWFLIHDYDKELSIFEHYIGYSHYWAVFTTFFKKYKPTPEIMKYTMNEMTYKSRLKELGSVDKWLYDGVLNGLITYRERLLRGSDFELHYINEKIRAKFRNAMKTIYRAQEKNEKEKHYVFTSVTQMGDDIIENPSKYSDIISSADNYTAKFFANPINEKALKGCLIPKGISEKDLRTVILMIADNRDNMEDLHKLFESFFYLFLDNNKYTIKDIGSLRFYTEMQKIYKPGNTNDVNRNNIKAILDKWLSMGSATFRTTNRTATITTFRKSIYDYFILKIMQDK